MMFWNVTTELFRGFGTTCLLFLLTLAVSLPLGLLVAFGSMSRIKALSIPVRVFVWIMRGTPLMLQIFVVFYVPGFIGISMKNRFVAALIAFGLNYAAYFSEVYRGGFQGIARGQYEACAVLGLTKWQTFYKIVLPQVIKRILPPMSNEIMTLVKDTSLASVIGVIDIIWLAKDFVSASFIIWPLFYAGVFYLLFNGILTVLFGFAEKKLNYYR